MTLKSLSILMTIFFLQMIHSHSLASSKFQYATELTKDEKDAVEHAVITLQQDLEINPAILNKRKQLNKTKRLFGISEISNQALLKWLKKRIQFFISTKSTFDMTVSKRNQAFFDPEMPDAMAALSPSVKNSSKIMQQISSQYYINGKTNFQVLNLSFNIANLNGDKKITLSIDSPRVGIVEMADDYIQKTSFKDSFNFSLVDDLIRLFYLFHEARHSDGHGKTLGMGHVICPFDHKYANYPVCDIARNGAYAVSAELLKLLMNNCNICSDNEKLYLGLLYDDAQERIIGPRLELDARAETTKKIIENEN